MALNPIEILINARDNASGVFDRLNNKLKVVGVAIAGYFGIKAFVGIVEGAAEFEAALSRVQAATGASAEEMERLKKAAEDAGANTKYTSVEAAAALENLAKAGLSAGDAIETLPAVLALAQAGDIDLATSAEYVTKAVMGMGLAFSDAARVADVLALGANATNTSVEGLAQALSYAAPTANSLGVSLESTVAIIGKFADAGIDASRAGTALNSIMSQFSAPASKFRKELGAIGITTGDFEQALHQLADSGARGSQAINAVGLEAGPALKALLNQGMPALDDLKAKLDGAAGSAAATAKTMEDNLKGSMTGLASAWDTVKNVLGTPVLPVIKDGVDKLAGAFRSAVADGTVQKFGEAIAVAFQAGIKWIKEFTGQVDFTQVAAKLRELADKTGEIFTQVGEHATKAAGVFKVAYGAIQTSGNTLMASLYGTATGLTLVIQGLIKGMELLYRASAKVTFGDMSEQYKKIADELKISSDGMGAAVEELSKKVRESLSGTAEGMSNVVVGFTGIAGAAASTAPAVNAVEDAVAALSEEMRKEAEAAYAAIEAEEKKQEASTQAAQAAIDHKDAAQALRAEYEKQVALGNWQAAAEVMVKIEASAKGASAAVRESSQQIEASAKAAVAYNSIAEAGLRLELAKEKAYEASAKAAGNEAAQLRSKIKQKEIEIQIIEATARAMAEEAATSIRVAEAKMTEAEASKDGLTPELEAELISRINLAEAKQLDAKATAAGADNLRAEITMLKNGTDARDKSTAAIDRNRTALEKLNAEKEREIAAQEKSLDLATRELKLQEAKRAAGTIQGADAVPTFNSTEEAEAWKKQWMAQYQKDNPFSTKRGSQLGNFMFDMTMFEYKKELEALALRDAMKNATPGAERNTSSTQTPSAGTSTTTVNITVEGTTRSINTDAQGAATLQELVRQLAQAKGAASR